MMLDQEPLAGSHEVASSLAPGSHSEADDVRCRSEVESDESPGAWALVILLAAVTLGVWLGHSLILGAPDAARFTQANRSALELWAGLEGLLCGYGLAALVAMTHW
jgi:hypothetical protein